MARGGTPINSYAAHQLILFSGVSNVRKPRASPTNGRDISQLLLLLILIPPYRTSTYLHTSPLTPPTLRPRTRTPPPPTHRNRSCGCAYSPLLSPFASFLLYPPPSSRPDPGRMMSIFFWRFCPRSKILLFCIIYYATLCTIKKNK